MLHKNEVEETVRNHNHIREQSFDIELFIYLSNFILLQGWGGGVKKINGKKKFKTFFFSQEKIIRTMYVLL